MTLLSGSRFLVHCRLSKTLASRLQLNDEFRRRSAIGALKQRI
jgi:hypothetical protein